MQPIFYILKSYFCTMYLYNVSIIVERSENHIFYPWLHTFIVNSIEQETIHFLKLQDSHHDGETYCLQIHCRDKSLIEDFKTKYIVPLQDYITQHHQGKILIFDSLMEHLITE